jgi:hypothetical protein
MTDFVRLEVETGLSRGVRVIPLLIDDARMPAPEDLPQSLAPLTRKHALELTPAHFNRDAEELVKVLDDVLLELTAPLPKVADPILPSTPANHFSDPGQTAAWAPVNSLPAPGRARVSGRRWIWLAVTAAILLGGVGAAVAVLRDKVGTPSPQPPSTAGLFPRSAEPLGSDVMVWRGERDRVWRIATVDVTGRQRTALTSGRSSFAAMLTPDRRTVLYLRDEADGSSTLHAVSADGKEDRALFADGTAACPVLRRPAVRADETLVIACDGYAGNGSALNVMSAQGRVLRQLDAGVLGDPTFTLDGRQVIYWRVGTSAKEEGGSHKVDGGALFEVPVDGSTHPVRLTDGKNGSDADPVVAPKGDELAFRRIVDERKELFTIPLAQGLAAEPDRLVKDSAAQDPSWSPDGSRLAYRHGPDDDSDLYLVNADGTDRRKLLTNDGPDTTAVWTSR